MVVRSDLTICCGEIIDNMWVENRGTCFKKYSLRSFKQTLTYDI